MKFLSSYYNEESGTSIVQMEHLDKEFLGMAQCHPEEEYPSKYAGCQYAEIRATIKALKYERKLLKEKVDFLKQFVRRCEDRKDFCEDEYTPRAVYKELNYQIDRVNELTDKINELLDDLDKLPKRRDIVNKAMDRRHKVEEEQSTL